MIEVSYLGALTAGLLTFFAPCTLPLIPAFIAYLAGNGDGRFKLSSGLMVTLGFTLGFSTLFILFGLAAGVFGQTLISHRDTLTVIGGIVVILLGLILLFGSQIPWLARFSNGFKLPSLNNDKSRFTASFAVGLAFASGFSPCLGPILGAILTIAATSGSITTSTALLASFSLGLALPFFVVTIFYQQLANRINRISPKFLDSLQIAGGLIFIIFGIMLLTGSYGELIGWLLQTYEEGFIARFGDFL